MSNTIVSVLTLRSDENGAGDGDEDFIGQEDRDDRQNDDTSKYYVVLEQIDSSFVQNDFGAVQEVNPYIIIYCYPTNAELNATFEIKETRIKSCTEVLHFNGTDGVRLKYPQARSVSINSLGNFYKIIEDEDGNQIDIESTSPSLRFSSSTNSILSNDQIKIYGACSVSYQVEYKVIHFYPDPVAVAPFNSINDKTESYFGGVLIASVEEYIGGFFANRRLFLSTLEIKLNPPPKPIEYARVYSKIVIDIDGVHETPNGWTKNTTIDGYRFNTKIPGAQLKEELDPDNAFTDERLHLLITIDVNGQLHYEFHSHYYQDPFDKVLIQYMDGLRAQVYGGWSVEFIARFADPPGGRIPKSAESFYFDMYNLTWRDVFLKIDKTKIFSNLKDNHYPRLTEEGSQQE